MPAPARLHRVARADDQGQAAARLYQALYGCTLHSAGLLHAIAACLAAEAEGRFTLAGVAAHCAAKATADRDRAAPGDAWRYETMAALCQRLAR